MKNREAPPILPDGTPAWLPQIERWLVGAAMLSSQEDVVTVSASCLPGDFRDEQLGRFWAELPFLDDCPCAAHLTIRMGAEYGPELVELAFAQGAWLYASRACMESHAVLVHQWGEKRRRLQALSQEAQEVYAGEPTNVIPITRATGVRPFVAS